MTLPPPVSRRHRRAFTLVELLTVIAIITILIALLFPGLSVMRTRTHNPAAARVCQSIIVAAKAYQTDYGKFPNPLAAAPATPADVIVGDPEGRTAASNDNLFNILRAIPNGTNRDHAINPKKVVFYEDKTASNPAKPKNGFGSDGAYFDPWGAQYCVALDVDSDNQLTALPYTDFNGPTKGPRVGAGAYSLGKDGKLGLGGSYRSGSDKSDDSISWQ